MSDEVNFMRIVEEIINEVLILFYFRIVVNFVCKIERNLMIM